MKTNLRFSRASGSTQRRVEQVVRRGWQPGFRVSDYYKTTRRSRRSRRGAGNRAS